MVPSDLLVFEYDGAVIRFWLPEFRTDFVQRIMMRNRCFWERKVLEKVRCHFPEAGVFVDVGAFVGNHAVYFAKICGAKRVICFEPQLHFANVIAQNVALNSLEHIVDIYPNGLGDRVGHLAVTRSFAATAAMTSFDYDEGGLIKAETLDLYHLNQVDLLKIDVEGMESKVVEGAKETLLRTAPIVWLEAVSAEAKSKLSRCLSDLGYEFLEQVSEMDLLFSPGFKRVWHC